MKTSTAMDTDTIRPNIVKLDAGQEILSSLAWVLQASSMTTKSPIPTPC
jgi:hypothetical protein